GHTAAPLDTLAPRAEDRGGAHGVFGTRVRRTMRQFLPMRFLGCFVMLCTVSIELDGCSPEGHMGDATRTQVGSQPRLQSATPPADVVVSLRKTECLGECPVYRVRIFSSGLVDYVGEEHVAV